MPTDLKGLDWADRLVRDMTDSDTLDIHTVAALLRLQHSRTNAKPKDAEGLKLGSRLTVEGVEAVVVAKAALDWLNGEGDDFERPDGVRGAFWWRTEFKRRAMLSAAGETK